VHLITVAAVLPGTTPTRKGESPRGYLDHVRVVLLLHPFYAWSRRATRG
jgi:hypothetical protein